MTQELLQDYKKDIKTLTLIPSGGGCFEVKVDDTLVFSKRALGRKAEPGEIAELLERDFGFEKIVEE